MINETLKSVLELYNSSLISASIPLYFQEAPQGTNGKYGVMYFMGSTQDELMGGADDNIRYLDLQINLFTNKADGGIEISQMAKDVRAVLDWQKLAIDGYSCLKFQPTGVEPILYLDNIWQITIGYEVGITKI